MRGLQLGLPGVEISIALSVAGDALIEQCHSEGTARGIFAYERGRFVAISDAGHPK
jgi:hypothetical protein